MIVKIQKWGNSSGIRLPAHLLVKLNIQSGQEIELIERDGEIMLKPIKQCKKYNLSELVAQCDFKAPQAQEVQDWQDVKPVGKEVW